MSNTRHSSYLRAMFDGDIVTRGETIRKCTEVIESLPEQIDCIAGRGTSGLTMGAIVAYVMDLGFIAVRKRGEYNHGSHFAEGTPANIPFNYVIIDDLVCSGNTIRNIVWEIGQVNGEANCVGIVTYNDGHNVDDLPLFRPLTELYMPPTVNEMPYEVEKWLERNS